MLFSLAHSYVRGVVRDFASADYDIFGSSGGTNAYKRLPTIADHTGRDGGATSTLGIEFLDEDLSEAVAGDPRPKGGTVGLGDNDGVMFHHAHGHRVRCLS